MTLPFTDTFNDKTDGDSIPVNNPTTNISGSCPAYYTYGEWDDDVPNPTAGTPPPSGGVCAKGVLGDTSVTGAFMTVNCGSSNGVIIQYYVYLHSDLYPGDPPTTAGIEVLKIARIGDTNLIDSDHSKHRWQLDWWPSWTASQSFHPYDTDGHNYDIPCSVDPVFDEWMKIRIYWHFGTYSATEPDEPDGIFRVWLNDVLVCNREDLWLNHKANCDGLVSFIKAPYHLKPGANPHPTGAAFWVDDFTVQAAQGAGAAPIVTRVIPRNGPLSGYNVVTVKGENFTGASRVQIGGGLGTDVTVVDSETLTCRAPAGRADASTGDVIVTVGSQTGTLLDGYTYKDVTSYRIDDHYTADPIGSNWTEIDNGDGYLEHKDSTRWCLRNTSGYSPGSGDDALARYTGTEDSDCRVVIYGTRDDTAAYARIDAFLRCAGASFGVLDAYGVYYLILPSSHVYQCVVGWWDNGSWSGQSAPLNESGGSDQWNLPASWRFEMTVHSTTFEWCLADNSTTDAIVYPSDSTEANSYAMSKGFSGNAGWMIRGGANWGGHSDDFKIDRVIVVDSTSVATPPTVTEISPVSGINTGGTSVTITGTGFSTSPGVHFGVAGDWTSATSIVRNSATEITCNSPAKSSSNTVHVRVTNTDGLWDYLPDAFQYIAAVDLTDISPVEGDDQGGTTVTLEGTGFQEGCYVWFGDNECEDVTYVDSTEVTVATPAGTGTVDVTLINPDTGEDTLSSAFTYIEGLAPPDSPAAGEPGAGPLDLPAVISFTARGTLQIAPERKPRAQDTLAREGTEPGTRQRVETRFGGRPRRGRPQT